MDETKRKAVPVDTANEPVDLDDDDGMIDTGVLHEVAPKGQE